MTAVAQQQLLPSSQLVFGAGAMVALDSVAVKQEQVDGLERLAPGPVPAGVPDHRNRFVSADGWPPVSQHNAQEHQGGHQRPGLSPGAPAAGQQGHSPIEQPEGRDSDTQMQEPQRPSDDNDAPLLANGHHLPVGGSSQEDHDGAGWPARGGAAGGAGGDLPPSAEVGGGRADGDVVPLPPDPPDGAGADGEEGTGGGGTTEDASMDDGSEADVAACMELEVGDGNDKGCQVCLPVPDWVPRLPPRAAPAQQPPPPPPQQQQQPQQAARPSLPPVVASRVTAPGAGAVGGSVLGHKRSADWDPMTILAMAAAEQPNSPMCSGRGPAGAAPHALSNGHHQGGNGAAQHHEGGVLTSAGSVVLAGSVLAQLAAANGGAAAAAAAAGAGGGAPEEWPRGGRGGSLPGGPAPWDAAGGGGLGNRVSSTSQLQGMDGPLSVGAGGGGDDDLAALGPGSKRPRLAWTAELHARFVKVVDILGLHSAVPKTILKMMDVKGLTREQVASHLQKYRLYMKKGGNQGGGPGGQQGDGMMLGPGSAGAGLGGYAHAHARSTVDARLAGGGMLPLAAHGDAGKLPLAPPHASRGASPDHPQGLGAPPTSYPPAVLLPPPGGAAAGVAPPLPGALLASPLGRISTASAPPHRISVPGRWSAPGQGGVGGAPAPPAGLLGDFAAAAAGMGAPLVLQALGGGAQPATVAGPPARPASLSGAMAKLLGGLPQPHPGAVLMVQPGGQVSAHEPAPEAAGGAAPQQVVVGAAGLLATSGAAAGGVKEGVDGEGGGADGGAARPAAEGLGAGVLDAAALLAAPPQAIVVAPQPARRSVPGDLLAPFGRGNVPGLVLPPGAGAASFAAPPQKQQQQQQQQQQQASVHGGTLWTVDAAGTVTSSSPLAPPPAPAAAPQASAPHALAGAPQPAGSQEGGGHKAAAAGHSDDGGAADGAAAGGDVPPAGRRSSGVSAGQLPGGVAGAGPTPGPASRSSSQVHLQAAAVAAAGAGAVPMRLTMVNGKPTMVLDAPNDAGGAAADGAEGPAPGGKAPGEGERREDGAAPQPQQQQHNPHHHALQLGGQGGGVIRLVAPQHALMGHQAHPAFFHAGAAGLLQHAGGALQVVGRPGDGGGGGGVLMARGHEGLAVPQAVQLGGQHMLVMQGPQGGAPILLSAPPHLAAHHHHAAGGGVPLHLVHPQGAAGKPLHFVHHAAVAGGAPLQFAAHAGGGGGPALLHPAMQLHGGGAHAVQFVQQGGATFALPVVAHHHHHAPHQMLSAPQQQPQQQQPQQQ